MAIYIGVIKLFLRYKINYMISAKIYFTLCFSLAFITFLSLSFMVDDYKRADLWYRVGVISMISLATLIFGGVVFLIWF